MCSKKKKHIPIFGIATMIVKAGPHYSVNQTRRGEQNDPEAFAAKPSSAWNIPVTQRILL